MPARFADEYEIFCCVRPRQLDLWYEMFKVMGTLASAAYSRARSQMRLPSKSLICRNINLESSI